MKRLLFASLTAAILGALAACSGQSSKPGDAPATPAQPATPQPPPPELHPAPHIPSPTNNG